MTKQEILDEFDDIDFVYNNSSKHETLSHMLDELLEEKELKEQCLKTKCVICPHCDHCDVDEMGKIKEQETVPDDTKKKVLADRQCEVSPHHYERKGFCPKCHQEVKFILNRNYCGFCGQAVKWND